MIALIAAIGKNNELGKNNDLIWHLPNDLKFFKEVTMGKNVVMGLNTYKSLPRKLNGRNMIVLSDVEFKEEGIIVYNDLKKLLEDYKNEDIYIIGGASLYKLFINKVDTMYLTEIDASDDKADVYFPKFNKDDWNREVLKENSDNDIKYKHVRYRRKYNYGRKNNCN